MSDKIKACLAQGQSIWLDFIRRSHTEGGGLQALVDQGLRGVTSNPTIFEKAIAGGSDYAAALAAAADQDLSVPALYEMLALEDVRRAADVLRPVYDTSLGGDGYVSLEVSPALARDRAGTVAEARRLNKALDRPNVMIKIPATAEGIEASSEVVGEGINVNMTLIFTLRQASAVARAYKAGLRRLAAGGAGLGGVASVASVFVSRLDAKVTAALARCADRSAAAALCNQVAVANCKSIYALYGQIFGDNDWARLQAGGARPQRLLWASTGTKDPALVDTYYVDSLVGPGTVNTVPPATLEAFLDHGSTAPALVDGLAQAEMVLKGLAAEGIDLESLGADLLEEGLLSFGASFSALQESIRAKSETLKPRPGATTPAGIQQV